MESILSIYWTNTRDSAKLYPSGEERRPDGRFPGRWRSPMSSRPSIPLSSCVRNPDWPQEAGSAPGRLAVKIHNMESRTATPSFLPSDPRLFMMATRLLLLLVASWIVSRATLHAAVVATPHVTLIVYADKPMSDPEWTALSAALGKSFDGAARETHSGPDGFQIVRGETLAPGAQFESVIPVYLHGSCRLLGEPAKAEVRGPLGWVLRDQGQIKPFIHVDCAPIAAMLGQQALWMKPGARDAAMAEAISRVVLHEWV